MQIQRFRRYLIAHLSNSLHEFAKGFTETPCIDDSHLLLFSAIIYQEETKHGTLHWSYLEEIETLELLRP